MYKAVPVCIGDTEEVNLISWSPNGKYIVSSSSADVTMRIYRVYDATMRVWDAIKGTCIHTIKDYWVNNLDASVSWSPDSKYIISGSQDETVDIWDITTGNRIRTLTGHIIGVHSVSWSPDSKYIVSGSEEIKVWDVQSGTCIHTLTGHTNNVFSVSWSPDGSQLVSGACDETVRVWNVIDKKLIDYLYNTLSWEQVLLVMRIVSKQDINFAHDIQAQYCYNSLPENIKQLVEPLLSKATRTTLLTIKD